MVHEMKIYHFQSSPDDSTDDVGVEETLVALWQLHKIHQRVLVQNERELVALCTPVGHRWNDPQEHLEPHLWTGLVFQVNSDLFPHSVEMFP